METSKVILTILLLLPPLVATLALRAGRPGRPARERPLSAHQRDLLLARDREWAGPHDGVFVATVRRFEGRVGIQDYSLVPNIPGVYMVEVPGCLGALQEVMRITATGRSQTDHVYKLGASKSDGTLRSRFRSLHADGECGRFLRASNQGHGKLRFLLAIVGLRPSQTLRAETLLKDMLHDDFKVSVKALGELRERGEFFVASEARFDEVVDMYHKVAMDLNYEELGRLEHDAAVADAEAAAERVKIEGFREGTLERSLQAERARRARVASAAATALANRAKRQVDQAHDHETVRILQNQRRAQRLQSVQAAAAHGNTREDAAGEGDLTSLTDQEFADLYNNIFF